MCVRVMFEHEKNVVKSDIIIDFILFAVTFRILIYFAFFAMLPQPTTTKGTNNKIHIFSRCCAKFFMRCHFENEYYIQPHSTFSVDVVVVGVGVTAAAAAIVACVFVGANLFKHSTN